MPFLAVEGTVDDIAGVQQRGGELTVECSSSDNLRPLRHFEKGGSGSSRVKV